MTFPSPIEAWIVELNNWSNIETSNSLELKLSHTVLIAPMNSLNFGPNWTRPMAGQGASGGEEVSHGGLRSWVYQTASKFEIFGPCCAGYAMATGDFVVNFMSF
ncbi:Hypothetical predicted protein, partial [Olea europaea subsp. europaea]